MTRVTVVVPTKDSARTLGRCLASITSQTHNDIELVVVDNGSLDETREIAVSYGARVEQWGPERSAQRNRGLALATGELVAFVDSDMTLEPEIMAEAVACFGTDVRVGAVVLPERSHGEGYFAACRALEKELYVGDPDVEAARVFRRDLLTAVDGYDETLTSGEDWDLADRVEGTGCLIGRTTAYVWHDEGRVRLGRCFAKKRYYGVWLVRYLQVRDRGRARSLVRPRTLRRAVTLLRRPVLGAGLVLLKAVEVAGFATGIAQARWGSSRS